MTDSVDNAARIREVNDCIGKDLSIKLLPEIISGTIFNNPATSQQKAEIEAKARGRAVAEKIVERFVEQGLVAHRLDFED